MNMTRTFQETRKPAETIERVILAQDLLSAGWENVRAYNEGFKTSRYHFHVLNMHNVYVTIIITKENMLTLRGKSYTKLNDLFSAIDTYKN